MNTIIKFRSAALLILAMTAGILLNGCNSPDQNAKAHGAIATKQTAADQEVWTCSMHPEIIRNKPGTCPICGMDLVKKETSAAAKVGLQLGDLLQPTGQFVVSSIPVTGIRTQKLLVEQEVLGTVSYDTRRVSTISARVSGRIEKLYVHYRYQHVHQGERIMDIYSPELSTGQQDLLFLLKNDPGNAPMIGAAKQKLLLLGMSEGQLQEVISTGKMSLTVSIYSNYSGHIHEAGTMAGIGEPIQRMDLSGTLEPLPIKEGMYLEKGQTVFQVFNTDKSWVLLHLFPGEEGAVKTGDAVRIVPETAPDKGFRGKIDFIEPFYRQGDKTLTARVYFDNSAMQIPIGSQVRATISGKPLTGDWLPKDALLSLGMDQVIFVRRDGGFKAQKVITGVAYKDRIQILSGLTATDSVASNAQYLMDSESFIKTNH
jgi:Cu(I)/Ag(I) efflux system membrane fusion protein